MDRIKVRIRFRKGGDLRLVSHHDLMRCFERMFRRAGIPFRSTEGFNPKPRMAFALSLGLGIVGCAEVLDLELTEPISAEEIHSRLAHQAPAGLGILSVHPVHGKHIGAVRRIGYRVVLPADDATGLASRIAELLASPNCWIERSRPQPRRLDVRPYICSLYLSDHTLEMELCLDSGGTVRPEEILTLLGVAGCLEQGALIERTTLQLEDEEQASAVSASGPSNSNSNQSS